MADQRIAAGAARSPLGASSSSPHVVASGANVEVLERPFTSQVSIRLDPGSDAFTHAGEALGVPLPATPNRVERAGERIALWLGPDEWLVVAPAGTPVLAEADDVSLPGTDVSAHRTLLEIRGPDARSLMARGCPLDFDPRIFGADRCAQSLLARVDVIVFPLDGEDSFGVLVRASFAPYLVAWLRDAIEGLDA